MRPLPTSPRVAHRACAPAGVGLGVLSSAPRGSRRPARSPAFVAAGFYQERRGHRGVTYPSRPSSPGRYGPSGTPHGTSLSLRMCPSIPYLAHRRAGTADRHVDRADHRRGPHCRRGPEEHRRVGSTRPVISAGFPSEARIVRGLERRYRARCTTSCTRATSTSISRPSRDPRPGAAAARAARGAGPARVLVGEPRDHRRVVEQHERG